MPQVINKAVLRDLENLKVPRGQKSVSHERYTDETRRRATIINKIEERMFKFTMRAIDQNIKIEEHRKAMLERKYKENLRAIHAYKHVLRDNTFSMQDSYDEALKKNYSVGAFRGKIKDALIELDPGTTRMRKAHKRLAKCRQAYEDVMKQNLDKVETSTDRHLRLEQEMQEKIDKRRRESSVIKAKPSIHVRLGLRGRTLSRPDMLLELSQPYKKAMTYSRNKKDLTGYKKHGFGLDRSLDELIRESTKVSVPELPQKAVLAPIAEVT